jgi:UDP-N-acetylglucosamine 4-epimerase
LASIDKAKLLGYDPQFSLQEGLEEAIDWYWNNLVGGYELSVMSY